jgi:hypothetical protein
MSTIRTGACVLLAGLLSSCVTSPSTPTKTDTATETPTPTTTTTTTLTTTDGCATEVDVGSADCDQCIEENCCSDFEDYVAAPNDDDALESFSDCSAASCASDCAWGVCDSPLGMTELTVALCMGDSCCEPVKDCFADKRCVSCITTGAPSDCDATALDEQVISCAFGCGYGAP